FHRVVTEAMPRMNFEAELGTISGSFAQLFQKPVARFSVAMCGSFAISASVKFDHGRAERFGGVELRRVRLNEQRNADARFAQLAHKRRQTIVLACRIDAAFGRALLAL